MQRDPEDSNRMWIHPPLTSLPVGERCIKLSELAKKMRVGTLQGHKQLNQYEEIFSDYFYCLNYLMLVLILLLK